MDSNYGALLDQVRQDLDGVDAALKRLEEGSYGRCEVCGEELPADKLAAQPVLRCCARCR